MIDYTNTEPVFHKKISVIETQDPVHANVVNSPIKQLADNTLYLKKLQEEDKVAVDEELNEESENPIQNAAVAAALKKLEEAIAEIRKMLPAAPPTAADVGKVFKIGADGKVGLAEDYGSSWQARYPEFLSGEDVDISDKQHIVSEDDFGFRKITDRDDKNIMETLYDSTGTKVAQKETVVGSEHIIGRLVVDDESEESEQNGESE